jgi:AraC-like DNA-binding protein
MDIHTVGAEPFSIEDVVKAHMEDLAIQEKFGVTQIKYWVNEETQTIFCLMRGPDKESCHLVHKESHGNTACNIIEVSDNEYNLYMGIGPAVNDLAKTESGEVDTGYRTFLSINFVSLSGEAGAKKEIYRILEENEGVVIPDPSNTILISFIYASDAIKCAKNVRTYLEGSAGDMIYSMGISTGEPVDEHGDAMFEETKKRVSTFVSLGLNSNIYVDHESMLLANKEQHVNNLSTDRLSVLNTEGINQLLELNSILSSNQTNPLFNAAMLDSKLGLSKSKAYRTLLALTGLSQNKIIQDYRLGKAILLLSEGTMSIAEIAYDCGFNSPSYFTRSFKKRYGISPNNFGASDKIQT